MDMDNIIALKNKKQEMFKNVLVVVTDKEFRDRDCFIYTRIEDLKSNHKDICNNFIVCGANFSINLEIDDIDEDNFYSVLNYEELLLFSKGIITNGMKEKLLSKENFELMKKLALESFKENYNFNEDELDEILIHYPCSEDYIDFSIISRVWGSTEEIGEEYVDNCYDLDSNIKRYIDYENLGNDISKYSSYLELSDYQIVEYAY